MELGPVVRFVEATGGSVASIRSDRLPVASTSMWTRSAHPDADEIPLRLHFEIKAALGFRHAVIVGHRTEVRRPSRLGERIGSHQELRSVGAPGPTPLGPGRRWEIDLVLTDADGDALQVETFSALGYRPEHRREGSTRQAADLTGGPGQDPSWSDRTIARAATACRVWAPVHHDPVVARRAGLPGVVACTQHLVSIIERSVGSLWAPGSMEALDVRLRRPVVAGPAPQVALDAGPGRRLARVRIRQAGALCCDATVLHR